MKVNRRVKQFAIGLLAMLSLFTASVSACTCSHHEAVAKPEVSSCHHHSEMSEMAESDDSQAENTSTCLSSDEDCVCAENTKNIVAKFEAIKLKKHAASANSLDVRASVKVLPANKTIEIGLVKPSYLSDPFYNLAPKRGPPVI